MKTATEILDGCTHVHSYGQIMPTIQPVLPAPRPPCRACAEAAIAAAVAEERASCRRIIECLNGSIETEDGLIPEKYAPWVNRLDALAQIDQRGGK